MVFPGSVSSSKSLRKSSTAAVIAGFLTSPVMTSGATVAAPMPYSQSSRSCWDVINNQFHCVDLLYGNTDTQGGRLTAYISIHSPCFGMINLPSGTFLRNASLKASALGRYSSSRK